MGKKLTLSMGYESWVSRVRQIAARVEAMNSYRPNSSKLQTGTFFIPGRGTVVPHLSNSSAKQPLSDPDGDTIMGGVNALTAANAKGRNKGQKHSQVKPRAPWRSQDEFRKLLDKGLCTRCGKPGHGSFKCQKYRPAIPPETGVSLAEVETNELCGDSGNEEP